MQSFSYDKNPFNPASLLIRPDVPGPLVASLRKHSVFAVALAGCLVAGSATGFTVTNEPFIFVVGGGGRGGGGIAIRGALIIRSNSIVFTSFGFPRVATD